MRHSSPSNSLQKSHEGLNLVGWTTWAPKRCYSGVGGFSPEAFESRLTAISAEAAMEEADVGSASVAVGRRGAVAAKL